MQEVFEKILEKIDSYIEDAKSEGDFSYIKPFEIAKIAVQEVAEEYNDGWIPCSERLPSGLDFVLYTHKDGEVDICSIEYFYDYLDKFTAWQPLPEPYQPKGE